MGIQVDTSNNMTVMFNRIFNQTNQGMIIQATNNSDIVWNEILDWGIAYDYINSENNSITNNSFFKGPILDSVVPTTDIDGIITLEWSQVAWATYYLVYRCSSLMEFFDLVGMTFLNVTTNSTSINLADGVYYFVIIAGNATHWTTISNNILVTVSITSNPPTDLTWLVILIIVLCVVGGAVGGLFALHKTGKIDLTKILRR